MAQKLTSKQRRTFRTRNKLRLVNVLHNPNRDVRPRLSVHRSGKQIYVQIIDDAKGVTLAAASSLEEKLDLKNGGNVAAATAVGKAIAEKAKAAGVTKVVFDRGSFLYHGRIKAVAEGAREGGLDF